MPEHLARLTTNCRVGVVGLVSDMTGLPWTEAAAIAEDALESCAGLYLLRVAEAISRFRDDYRADAAFFKEKVREFAGDATPPDGEEVMAALERV